MRFLSILRIAKHQRFNIEPRYYDEVKEDIEQRTSRIKRELTLERKERREGVAGSIEHSRINGAFSNRSRIEAGQTGFLRFAIIVYLFGGFVGYLYLGNVVLYGMLSIIPVYYFLRWRKLI
jgi:hypothetical protein